MAKSNEFPINFEIHRADGSLIARFSARNEDEEKSIIESNRRAYGEVVQAKRHDNRKK